MNHSSAAIMMKMLRSCRSLFLLWAATLVLGAAVLLAQNTNDLPAAPSEVNKPKPGPKQAPPAPEPSTGTAQSSQVGAGTARSDASAPQPKQEADDPITEGP